MMCEYCENGKGLGDSIKIPEADLPLKDKDDIKISVRKWSDTEWHEPTVDYMGIEDADR